MPESPMSCQTYGRHMWAYIHIYYTLICHVRHIADIRERLHICQSLLMYRTAAPFANESCVRITYASRNTCERTWGRELVWEIIWRTCVGVWTYMWERRNTGERTCVREHVWEIMWRTCVGVWRICVSVETRVRELVRENTCGRSCGGHVWENSYERLCGEHVRDKCERTRSKDMWERTRMRDHVADMCGSLKIYVWDSTCIAKHVSDMCERTRVRDHVADMCGSVKNICVGV